MVEPHSQGNQTQAGSRQGVAPEDREKLRRYLLSPKKRSEKKAALIKNHLLPDPDPWVADILLQALATQPDDVVLYQLIRAIGYRRDPHLVDAIRPFLTHKRARIYTTTLKAILRLDRDRGLRIVADQLEKQNDVGRAATLLTLAKIDEAALLEQLRKLCRHPSPDTRNTALFVLTKTCVPGHASLGIELLASESNPRLLEGLARFLERMGDPESLGALKSVIQSVEDLEGTESPRSRRLRQIEDAVSKRGRGESGAGHGANLEDSTILPPETVQAALAETEATASAPLEEDEEHSLTEDVANLTEIPMDTPPPQSTNRPERAAESNETNEMSRSENPGSRTTSPAETATGVSHSRPGEFSPLLTQGLIGVAVVCFLIIGLLQITESPGKPPVTAPGGVSGLGMERHALGKIGDTIPVEGNLINVVEKDHYIVLKLDNPVRVSIYFTAGLPIPAESLHLQGRYKATGKIHYIQGEQLLVLQGTELTAIE